MVGLPWDLVCGELLHHQKGALRSLTRALCRNVPYEVGVVVVRGAETPPPWLPSSVQPKHLSVGCIGGGLTHVWAGT